MLRTVGLDRATRASAAAAALLVACAVLLLVQAESAKGAFPGLNGSIVFNSNRDTGAGDIYSIRPGGEPRRITVSNSSSDPAYSPQGNRIAYISANPGGSYQVFLMAADGSGRVQLTTGSSAKQEPTWSPDGRQVAFVANSFETDGQTDPEIWAIGVDGTGLRQITHNTVPDTAPAWSPTGNRIAFERGQDIWTMKADGSDEINLTPNSPAGCSPNCYQGPDSEPSWHPNGSKIAYVHGYTPTGGGLPNIWTMDSNGSSKVNLSNNNAVAFTHPAWSPQGDKLAMVGAADTNRDIWVMNAAGGGQTPVETHPAHDINPDWGVLDDVDPNLQLAGKKNQKLSKAVRQKVSCDEDCALRGTGVLLIADGGGKTRTKLKPAETTVLPDQTATLKLKLKKSSLRAAKRALEEGSTVKAKLVVRATDGSGNTGKVKRKISLKG